LVEKNHLIRVHCFLDGVGFGGSGKRIIANAINLASMGIAFHIYAPVETITRLKLQFSLEGFNSIVFHSVGRYLDGQKALTDESLRKFKHEFKVGDVLHLVAPWTVPWRYRRSMLYSYVNVYFPFQSKVQYLKSLLHKQLHRKDSRPSHRHLRKKSAPNFWDHKKASIKAAVSSIYLDLKVLTIMWVCERVEILNPELQEYARSLYGRKKVCLTRGFASHAQFMVGSDCGRRRDKVVFLGRFEEQKGVHYLIQSIPAIAEFAASQKRMVEICIVGDGTFKSELMDLSSRFSGGFVRLTVFETNEIVALLMNAKIFLSLQKYSNYPSQSLIEAMACGVLPIVTNTGASHLMLPEGYRYLISEAEVLVELPKAIFEILSLTEDDFDDSSRRISEHVKSRISDGTQANYYLNLYRALSSRP
jgi:glycosyltransferase involved in cell wall biosynthesis